jgi:hypothetical protein
MALKDMYVVLVRERGLFLVEPRAGLSQAEAIEAALGLRQGYSTGLVRLELPGGADEAWVAWVEGTLPNGQPYFEYRALDPTLSEPEVHSHLEQNGEEILKLHRSHIYRP